MYLVRQCDGGPVQLWEVDPTTVLCSGPLNGIRGFQIQSREPKAWRFGNRVERARHHGWTATEVGDWYPMLCRPGVAAIGRTVEEALRLMDTASRGA